MIAKLQVEPKAIKTEVIPEVINNNKEVCAIVDGKIIKSKL
jgi:hypothetical protein